MERWRVVEKNTDYEVSDRGRIRKSNSHRVLSFYIARTGYPVIGLWNKDRKRRTKYTIHRLVASAFLDNPNGWPCVNHIDGNKENNNIDNLEWCSYSRNNKHAYDMRLKVPYQQRITESDMQSIEALSDGGMSVRDIASHFGVTESAIYQLRARGKIRLKWRRNRAHRECRE